MQKPQRWKGFAAGMAGGLAATAAMTGLQLAWSAAGEKLKNGNGHPSSSEELGSVEKSHYSSEEQEPSSHQREATNPTVKVAEKVSSSFGHELSMSKKKEGGEVVHYAFGTLMGSLYGLALESRRRRSIGRHVRNGLAFGSALFLAADEIALPALGLTAPPNEIELSTHAKGFASHLIYGLATGLLTGAIRNRI